MIKKTTKRVAPQRPESENDTLVMARSTDVPASLAGAIEDALTNPDYKPALLDTLEAQLMAPVIAEAPNDALPQTHVPVRPTMSLSGHMAPVKDLGDMTSPPSASTRPSWDLSAGAAALPAESMQQEGHRKWPFGHKATVAMAAAGVICAGVAGAFALSAAAPAELGRKFLEEQNFTNVRGGHYDVFDALCPGGSYFTRTFEVGTENETQRVCYTYTRGIILAP